MTPFKSFEFHFRVQIFITSKKLWRKRLMNFFKWIWIPGTSWVLGTTFVPYEASLSEFAFTAHAHSFAISPIAAADHIYTSIWLLWLRKSTSDKHISLKNLSAWSNSPRSLARYLSRAQSSSHFWWRLACQRKFTICLPPISGLFYSFTFVALLLNKIFRPIFKPKQQIPEGSSEGFKRDWRKIKNFLFYLWN